MLLFSMYVIFSNIFLCMAGYFACTYCLDQKRVNNYIPGYVFFGSGIIANLFELIVSFEILNLILLLFLIYVIITIIYSHIKYIKKKRSETKKRFFDDTTIYHQ